MITMTSYGNKKFLLICFFILFFITEISYSVENKIILKIENKIITTLDISNEINYLRALNPKIKNLDQKTLYKIGKNSITKEKIKELEILKYVKKLSINENYLEELIKSAYGRLGLSSKSEFMNYIKDYNLNFEQIKKKITIEASWNELIMAKYSNKLKIDKEKLKKKIIEENNKDRKIYLLSEILFDVSSNTQLNSKFMEIKESIASIGFENTAINFSKADSSKIGGKLGWIGESFLNNKIKEKINNINIGEITKPIITPGGFLVLLLEDIKYEKNKKDVDEELKILIRKETNSQLNQFSNIYFKKIQKNIEINEL